MSTLKQGPKEILRILDNMKLPNPNRNHQMTPITSQTYHSLQPKKIKYSALTYASYDTPEIKKPRQQIVSSIKEDPKFQSHKSRREQLDQERLQRLQQKTNYYSSQM
ncbi:hypothetical protein SS50377_25312 [Spironucleus salmonicida]|uniref:Uncharacterized protein n=1 Tax=Spironucleus salmonicida TaxID=348837 RepID=V6LBL2_9EUKA|nr:hypothetical protein SS50377_25312 [Spironucleus salmonicida]|eukprot:EST41807.1 Hypothetical protein SS50377_18641 [Spironucleus salmonicida]